KDGTFTTHDAPKADFNLLARTIRVYENDRVIFQYVTGSVGRGSVFWGAHLFQAPHEGFSFTISPAYLSSWGPSLLTQVPFPITDDIRGRVRLDYRGPRGLHLGFDSTF